MTILGVDRRGGPAVDAVIESVALGETGLAELVDRPRLVAWLDERRRSWTLTADSHPHTAELVADFRQPITAPLSPPRRAATSSPITAAVSRLRRAIMSSQITPESPIAPESPITPDAASLAATVSPAAVALASCDRDGHVRELAVRVIAAQPAPELMPFLVLRCGDWVGRVRETARAAVTSLLAEQPEIYLRAAVPMAAHTSDRFRGRWTIDQVHAATAAAFELVSPGLLASRAPVVRRLAYTVGVELGRWSRDDLLRFALRGPDSLIRSRAADAVAKDADVPTLRAMAGSRYAQVRAAALVELARLGLDADVAAAADDPAALVRAHGRTRLSDPAGHYRAAVAAHPTPGVIAGLGEVGSYSDETLLAPLLGHDDARIRAAAVRALTALDAVRPEMVLPLLRDPVAGVIRAAATALRPCQRRLPGELVWQWLGDPRVEVRRGAYRVVQGWDVTSALRASRQLAGDEDPGLARRGRDDVRRWERIVVEQGAG